MGKFDFHSLRRGGASFMSEASIPLEEIKNRGVFASLCILDYISPSVNQVVDLILWLLVVLVRYVFGPVGFNKL